MNYISPFTHCLINRDRDRLPETAINFYREALLKSRPTDKIA